jgi:hypothetical protein
MTLIDIYLVLSMALLIFVSAIPWTGPFWKIFLVRGGSFVGLAIGISLLALRFQIPIGT